jgi:hypothetical protein
VTAIFRKAAKRKAIFGRLPARHGENACLLETWNTSIIPMDLLHETHSLTEAAGVAIHTLDGGGGGRLDV